MTSQVEFPRSLDEKYDADPGTENEVESIGDPHAPATPFGNLCVDGSMSTLGSQIRRGPTTLTLKRPNIKSLGPWQSLGSIIFASHFNLLLPFIPFSWALHFSLPESCSERDVVILALSLFALIPLSRLHRFAGEKLSIRMGQMCAGLLTATLGNSVELIVAMIALVKGELRVVQMSLIGSVLTNLLLVLGVCFFVGGLRSSQQGFDFGVYRMNTLLLSISVAGFLLPTILQLQMREENRYTRDISHAVSIILILTYGGFMVFQFYSHTHLYSEKSIQATYTLLYGPNYLKSKQQQKMAQRNEDRNTDPEQAALLPERETEEEEFLTPSLSMTIGLIVVVTAFIAICAEWLVDSIGGLTTAGHLNKEFVSVILLPISGHIAEDLVAVTDSMEHRLNSSIIVAIGSSIQLTLFVMPLVVIVGWMLGQPLTLAFGIYEVVALFLGVAAVNSIAEDGKSYWLKGFFLICLYMIMGVTFWFYMV